MKSNWGESNKMADDEKGAMEILAKEYEWYKDVRDYMEKTFKWSKLVKVDREVLLDALMAMSRTRRMLLDVMENNHQDLSNNKSLINDERTKFYNLLFEISHETCDIALKDYLAFFQPSSNSLPFPHSDSKEDKDSNNITYNNTEPAEKMITKIRKRSPEEEEDEENEESSETDYPKPPRITCFDDGYLSTDDDVTYHDHSKCHLLFRYLEDNDDFEL